MTELQRLRGIVTSPGKTFSDIDERPSWTLPLVLVLAVTLAVSFVVYRVVVTDANFEQVARSKILWDAREAGKTEPPQEIDQQVNALRVQRERWYVPPFYGVAISVVAISVFYYLLLLVARAGTTFRKVFCVVCWSFPIYRVLGGLVTIAALLVRGAARFEPAPPEAWSPTSLAHLIPRDAVSANLYSALSKLDVFLVWWLVVMTIGFSRTSANLSLRKAALITIAAELAYLGLNAVGALPGAS